MPLTRAPIFFAPPWDAPTSTVPGGLGRGSSGRLDRRGGGGGRGARPVHAREPFSSLRAESGAARHTRVFLSQAAALALRTALNVKIGRLQGIPDGSDVTALYASLIDVQLRPWPFVPRPSPATEKRRRFSPRPLARSASG